MAGLVPAIPIDDPQRWSIFYRDRRDKPGDDKVG
jgi:hypothetical protein